MDKTEVRQKAQECIRQIRSIDFEHLGINEYSREYIREVLPNLEYFFRIYTDTILVLLKKEIPQGYFVDFGGGHGFLSLFLKKLGFKVIYCDSDPLSIQTITTLKEHLGSGPELIVEGSSEELLAYCTVNKLRPAYLIATDLIEHVFDLNVLFADLYQINPGFKMAFTTQSNPSNPYRVMRLRKLMVEVEKILFLPMRSDYIRENYPGLLEEEIGNLATGSRGLTYKGISEAVDNYLETGKMPEPDVDKYNTCDPNSGNWIERILPLKTYRKILNNNGFKVEFKRGKYNENNRTTTSLTLIRAVNKLLRHTGFAGSILAPYLIIKITPKK